MIAEPWMVVVAVQVVIAAAAWGRMEARTSANERVQRERHEENHDALKEIRDDVKRINGTVGRHDEAIRMLRGRGD